LAYVQDSHQDDDEEVMMAVVDGLDDLVLVEVVVEVENWVVVGLAKLHQHQESLQDQAGIHLDPLLI
jgi:hypothetical protein